MISRGKTNKEISRIFNKVLSLGGTAKVLPNTEVYARHELISAIDGLYSLNSAEGSTARC